MVPQILFHISENHFHILMGTTPVENFTKDGMGQTGCLRWTFTTLTMDIPNTTPTHINTFGNAT